MATTYEQLSASERAQIEALVNKQLATLKANNDAILRRTDESLTYYIANLVYRFAYELGYVIALPLAYAAHFAKDFGSGFADAWREIWG